MSGFASAMAASLSCPLGLRLRAHIDRAAHADIVEMLAAERREQPDLPCGELSAPRLSNLW
jgi:hypothetical protein